MADQKAVLENLTKRRDTLRENISRLQGRLESARADLASIEEECRKFGVPPEKLEGTIQELTRRFDTMTTDLTDRMASAEQALTPYLTR